MATEVGRGGICSIFNVHYSIARPQKPPYRCNDLGGDLGFLYKPSYSQLLSILFSNNMCHMWVNLNDIVKLANCENHT